MQQTVSEVTEPNFENLVKALAYADHLPAIYFVFSRKRCSEYAASFEESLVSPEQRAGIEAQLRVLRATHPDAVVDDMVPALLNGAASHHAGFLPGAQSAAAAASALIWRRC